MAHNFTTSTLVKNAMLAALSAAIDTGGPGTIVYYTGAQPTGPDIAVSTQTPLAIDTFSSTSFNTPSGGQMAANALSSGAATAAGTVTWARCFSGAGTPCVDLTVGTTGTDAIVGTVTIVIGNTIPVISFVITHS